MGPPTGALDTLAEALAVLVDGWRRMGTVQRAALVDGWSRDVRTLAEIGIRHRRPSASPAEVQIELGRLLYGADVVTDAVADAIVARRRRTGPG